MTPRALRYYPARFGYNSAIWRHYMSVIRGEVDAMTVDVMRKHTRIENEEAMERAQNVMWGTRAEEEVCRREIAERRGIDVKSEEAKEAGGMAFQTWFADLFYRSGGENIFEIQPVVLDLLRHSSIEEAIVEKVRLPFPLFYLHFGENSGISFGGGTHMLDGIYLENTVYKFGHREFESTKIEDSLGLVLTTRKIGKDYAQRISAPQFLEEEPTVQVYLSFESEAKFSAGIAKCLEQFEKDTFLHDSKARAFWNLKSLRETLELLTNVLLFLSSPHNDVVLRYPGDAPVNLVKKANDEQSQRARERSESKLKSLGFRRVHFIGDRLESELSAKYSAGELTNAHWRRGHWRAQVHGEGFKLRKNLWIMPTIVRADLGDPLPRRIYSVPT